MAGLLAELRSGLDALLPRFSAGPPPAVWDAEELLRAAGNWQRLAQSSGLMRANPSGAADTSRPVRERDELLHLLGELGGALAAWDGPLQQLLQGASALMLDNPSSNLGRAGTLFAAACIAGLGSVQAAHALGSSDEAALHICRSAQLVLGSGRLVATHAAAAMQRFASLHPREKGPQDLVPVGGCVTLQVASLLGCLTLADKAGQLNTFAQRLAPPQAFLAWLHALVAALQSGIPTPPRDMLLGLPFGLGPMLSSVCNYPAFQQHSKLLHADAALRATLTGMLLRSLRAAAVASRLPPDRQPEGLNGSTAPLLASALTSRCLLPALLQHLAGTGDAECLRLLQDVAVSMSNNSLPGAASSTVLAMHCHDIGLLSVAADQAMERQGIKWQAASALVPVLPHLASTLQLLAGTDSSSRFLQDGELVNKAIFNPWALIVQQLGALLSGSQAVSGAAANTGPDPAAWCTAAVAALQALPPLAAAAKQMQPGSQAATDTASVLAFSVLRMTNAVASMCNHQGVPQSISAIARGQPAGSSSGDPGESAAVAWPLHSAACRAAQWAAQEQEAPHSLLLGAQLLPELLALLSNSFSALAPANEPHGAQRWSRAVQGAAAAHWQALQALTAAAAPQGLPLDLDFGTATFLAEAACSGPTAIAHSPALLSLFCDLLRRLAQAGVHCMPGGWATLLLHARNAPRLAAQLATSGTLEALLEGPSLQMPGIPSLDSPLEAARGVLSALQEAATSEQAAIAGEAGSHSSNISPAWRQLDTAAQQLQAVLISIEEAGSSHAGLPALRQALPPATQLASALQACWQEQDQAPEAQHAAQLELAQAAATRTSCAHLACPNLAATSKRGSRCSGCHVARYCSRACSVADWRAGHKHACKLLTAAQEAENAAGER